MKTLSKLTLVLCLATVLTTTAQAILITDAGVVGIVNGKLDNSNPSSETAAAQMLLDMLANTTTGSYKTSPTEYAGAPTVVLGVATDADKTGASGGADVIFGGGYDYVLGKYGGEKGGYVLWYLGGAAFTIPGTSGSGDVGLWLNNGGNGPGLSHFTGFNVTRVPDAGATAGLLGLGFLGLSFVRRKIAN